MEKNAEQHFTAAFSTLQTKEHEWSSRISVFTKWFSTTATTTTTTTATTAEGEADVMDSGMLSRSPHVVSLWASSNMLSSLPEGNCVHQNGARLGGLGKVNG